MDSRLLEIARHKVVSSSKRAGIREVQRKMQGEGFAPEHPKAASDLSMWLEQAQRIRTQQRTDKN